VEDVYILKKEKDNQLKELWPLYGSKKLHNTNPIETIIKGKLNTYYLFKDHEVTIIQKFFNYGDQLNITACDGNKFEILILDGKCEHTIFPDRPAVNVVDRTVDFSKCNVITPKKRLIAPVECTQFSFHDPSRQDDVLEMHQSIILEELKPSWFEPQEMLTKE
jgi:hypothetical protein